MTAIITDDLKNKIIDDLYSDIDSSGNHYYIGFAKTTPWGVVDNSTAPQNGINYINGVRDNLQSVKKVVDFSRVAQRYNWSSGGIYNAYSNKQSETNPQYVVTDENKVYVCVQQGKDANGSAIISSVKPTATDVSDIEVTADGYAWKYMFSIGSIPASKYLSANFFPVLLLDSDTAVESYELEQVSIQDAAVPGQIIGIEVVDEGTGYTTGTVVIAGNGTGAAATATVNGGGIKKVEINETLGVFSFGAGYTRATISITGDGSGAKCRAILSPEGLGGNPIHDLRATALMYNTTVNGVQGNDFIVDNDFRQVVLIKNPKKLADSDFTDNSGIALGRLNIEAGYSSAPSVDAVIEGQTSGAKGVVNYFDSDGLKIWYNQDSDTGYKSFTSGESLVGYVMNLETVHYVAPDINKNSGSLLYIDNRNPVTRAADQIDDVKLVIKL